jgi:hypothetical protein
VKRKPVGETGVSSYIEAAAASPPRASAGAKGPVRRKAVTPEKQNAGIPSNRVKATFRLDPESLSTLEHERARRIAAGARLSDADKSDLINEAIRRTFGRA